MLNVRFGSKFKRDYKTVLKRGYNPALLETVIDLLRAESPLPQRYRDHALSEDYEGFRECHIASDWLLIYRIEDDVLVLVLSRTGSHSDLF